MAKGVSEEDIEGLEDRLQELKDRLSDLRKAGKDTGLIQPFVYNVKPKIKMVKATMEMDDFKHTKEYIEGLEQDAKDLEEDKEPGRIIEIIQEIYDLIREGDLKEAHKKYEFVQEFYEEADEDTKHLIYPSLHDVYKKMSE